MMSSWSQCKNGIFWNFFFNLTKKSLEGNKYWVQLSCPIVDSDQLFCFAYISWILLPFRAMSAQEILQIIQKKKRLKSENFTVKFHSRFMLAIMSLIFTIIFIRERLYGLINCSPPTYVTQNEFNSFCASGHVFRRMRDKTYLMKTPLEKSQDFG